MWKFVGFWGMRVGSWGIYMESWLIG